MNEYKYESRKKKRGMHCLITGPHGRICGCGHRTPVNKKYKTRIIRRALKNDFNE